jgi:hypothetical protein
VAEPANDPIAIMQAESKTRKIMNDEFGKKSLAADTLMEKTQTL